MAPTEPVTVEHPKHPLYALTTYELKDYRRQLEQAIAFSGQQAPVPAVRAGLDAALAEQDDRAGIGRA